MSRRTVGSRAYDVDDAGFLRRLEDWDEGYAEALAPALGIPAGLTPEHWRILRFIRDRTRETGLCPVVYETCRSHGLLLRDLEELFPTGYLRGACRLAGCSTRQTYFRYAFTHARPLRESDPVEDKVYRIDRSGYLVDPAEWDEGFAEQRAREMKMSRGLTRGHWRVLYHLRRLHSRGRGVPTVFEACTSLGLDLEDLERLFPDGYQRGAVKLAGLRIR
jgi:tRNA 2-thiouridine synthesizing protein E